MLQPHPVPNYFAFVLIGLIFCLCGDVCLALPQKRAFIVGLISFLLGHLLYIAAFSFTASFRIPALPAVLATLGVSTGVYLWLRPHLGRMHGPVAAYVVVITAMVCMVWGLQGSQSLNITGRRTALFGAIIFYLSDLFVARDRFLTASFVNRLAGLPTYYTGQFLLAFSVGLLK
ncbi:MAG: lysoplasmalogenase [Deltaproteobacteria bacterium]|nr:MAG: lysoplasmalogenase [Deltaproteobacteria bacterium]